MFAVSRLWAWVRSLFFGFSFVTSLRRRCTRRHAARSLDSLPVELRLPFRTAPYEFCMYHMLGALFFDALHVFGSMLLI
ncbi:hypothetical protein R3P38DRAFT_2996518 [Favolaschia claudopus]|uniref:Secreted protein n=1 Tax=Favolaschia claudopus TaxID=2862362 RepID=A0AAW0AQ28_9AGAR